jgi:hypothetical protein
MRSSPAQWHSLLYLQPERFSYPYELDFSVVVGLDKLIPVVGSRPEILSDYRAGDTGQHGFGRAIDTAWPGRDPLEVWNLARTARLFSGLGIYWNDLGSASFHFDTRLTRTVDNPALWGDYITHPYNPATDAHERVDDYTSADVILSMIAEKKSVIVPTAIGLTVLYLLTRRNQGKGPHGRKRKTRLSNRANSRSRSTASRRSARRSCAF